MSERNKCWNCFKWTSLVVLFIFFITSCNNGKITQQTDSPQQGTIYISVDESFKPVIEEQIKVYESTYPNAHIIASYKPEIDCFKESFVCTKKTNEECCE